MQKELNPDLFGESSTSKTRTVEAANPNASIGLLHVKEVDTKLAEMRTQMNVMIDNMNRFATQVNEALKTSHQKFEKMGQTIQRLEQNDQALALDNSQKLSQLGQKLGERRTLDGKVQEMIDRHNSVLKSYELRLNQLQKLIAEREQQIMNAQSALNEAKMEIARMKRF